MTPQSVLDFWFGPRDAEAFGKFRKEWFVVAPAFDEEVRRRFLETWQEAGAGRLDHWADTPEGSLALVIVLDQFPRNIFRGTPQAFATDAQACRVADTALNRGFDAQLVPVQRIFLYLPFEHAENLGLQQRCVTLTTALGDPMAIDYAVRHRDIIARFGRFPHRNSILGRTSTAEESRFLRQPNSSF